MMSYQLIDYIKLYRILICLLEHEYGMAFINATRVMGYRLRLRKRYRYREQSADVIRFSAIRLYFAYKASSK